MLLALVLSGCAGGASGSGEAAAAAVPAEITESSLNETGEEENPILVRRQMKKRKNSSGPILPEGKQM